MSLTKIFDLGAQNLFLLGGSLFAVGEGVAAFDSTLGVVTQAGAVGVLAWVAWTQRAEIRDLRTQHASVVENLMMRWDSWEKIRHEDSQSIDATLREITSNCAKTQAMFGGLSDKESRLRTQLADSHSKPEA